MSVSSSGTQMKNHYVPKFPPFHEVVPPPSAFHPLSWPPLQLEQPVLWNACLLIKIFVVLKAAPFAGMVPHWLLSTLARPS